MNTNGTLTSPQLWTAIQSWLPVLISVVALALSLLAVHRANLYRKFDFGPRLRMVDDHFVYRPVNPYTERREDFVEYRGRLQNKGATPIQIAGVWLEYGSPEDMARRDNSQQMGRFYLQPGEETRLECEVPSYYGDKLAQEYELGTCMYYLLVRYIDPLGKVVEHRRPLGGFTKDGSFAVGYPGHAVA